MNTQSRKWCVFEGSTALSSKYLEAQLCELPPPTTAISHTDRQAWVEPTELSEAARQELPKVHNLIYQFPSPSEQSCFSKPGYPYPGIPRIICNSAQLQGSECRGEAWAKKADLSSIWVLALAARRCSDFDKRTPWGTQAAHQENNHIHGTFTSCYTFCFFRMMGLWQTFSF